MDIVDEWRTLSTDHNSNNADKVKNQVFEAMDQAKNHAGLMCLLIFIAGVENTRVVQKGIMLST